MIATLDPVQVRLLEQAGYRRLTTPDVINRHAGQGDQSRDG